MNHIAALRSSLARLTAVGCLAALADAARGQEADAGGPIHWGYAAYFGTGHYEIGDSGDTYALAFKLRRRIRPAALDADGERQAGITVRLPVAVGVHDFDPASLGEALHFSNVSTVSAVPGVEIDVPITEHWSLKPVAYLGWGTQLDGDASAFIYWTGLKSRWQLRSAETNVALINSLMYVGYSPRSARSGHVLPWQTGFEFDRTLGEKTIGGDPVFLSWHVAYTSYLDELVLDIADTNRTSPPIDDEWELGIAFGKRGDRLRLWRLSWDRVGVAYRFSSDGEFSGISLTFQSLFNR